MADILHNFIDADEYHNGSAYDYSLMERKSEESMETISYGYPSFPAGERFQSSQEASDFFSEDGVTGPDASQRKHGIILHGILEKVNTKRDLKKAVDNAVHSGQISSAQGESYFKVLEEHIEKHEEWFSDSSEIYNESEIICADGSIQRPDRVIIRDGAVTVIDYKFGEEHQAHKRQVERYMSLYKELGYSKVNGAIWYISEDRVIYLP